MSNIHMVLFMQCRDIFRLAGLGFSWLMSQHIGYQFKHETLDELKKLVNNISSEMDWTKRCSLSFTEPSAGGLSSASSLRGYFERLMSECQRNA